VITSVDFYPTFLEIAGLDAPQDQMLDGISMLDKMIKEREDKDRPVYWHYPVYHHDVPKSVVRKGDFKLIQNLVDGSLELYDLQNDIGEKHNLADSLNEVRSQLFDLLERWQNEVDARKPIPNPDFDPDRRYEWGRHPDRK
jgi:uncharacterized sulfatase